MNKPAKTISQQIFFGYVTIITIIIILVSISILSLYNIRQEYLVLSQNRNHQSATQQAVSAHYAWVDNLGDYLQTQAPFTGSLDETTCSLGKWMSGISSEDLKDPTIRSTLDSLSVPHKFIHQTASQLMSMGGGKTDEKYTTYSQQIRPQVVLVIDGLSTISNRYQEISDIASVKLERFMFFAIIATLILALAAIILSVTYARKLADKISRPITSVANWSEQLSLGHEHLDFDTGIDDSGDCIEIETMVDSFRKLAKSLQENVEVVKRVAEGDMTAFVNIRSSHDSLGKNLYHLVQSNDLLFADILGIARTVANDSNQISSSSQTLADTASMQALAVSNLSGTIDMASNLVEECTNKTLLASGISEGIEVDMRESAEKMNMLLDSVRTIQNASEKVSSVIKTIDNISFQTNILALNASVEAARAGESGKGFAVVANEVRTLALKSAEAADQSKLLIEDTILRTKEGVQISSQTAETFAKTIDDIRGIITLVYEIADASSKQRVGIQTVRSEIQAIAQTASGYAAASEESAAASQQTTYNAEQLKQAMSKFNLRQRQKGQAYIPPEKRDDAEFIRKANENYKKAVESSDSEERYMSETMSSQL